MTYLDNAATSWPKPAAVTMGLIYGSRMCTSPGRGGHKLTDRAELAVYKCREAAAELFNVRDEQQVAFTYNATGALNMAIKGLCQKHARGGIVISGYEHNSVLRPCQALKARGMDLRVAHSPLFDRQAALGAVEAQIRPDTVLVIINHVSNVFGFILPIYEIGRLCKQRGIPYIIDASQSAGSIPVDFTGSGAACMCMPGHKGLLGGKGTGILICDGGENMATIVEGGTGSHSLEWEQPAVMPDRMESGTPNVEGIVSLYHGIKYVTSIGIQNIAAKERELASRAAAGLGGIPGIKTFYTDDDSLQTGVLSFVSPAVDSQSLGQRLAERDIAVRSGLHCAPLAHQSAGTLVSGTVRVSPGLFNSRRDVARLVRAVRGICGGG